MEKIASPSSACGVRIMSRSACSSREEVDEELIDSGGKLDIRMNAWGRVVGHPSFAGRTCLSCRYHESCELRPWTEQRPRTTLVKAALCPA